MDSDPIDMQTLADLLDEATILSRFDAGPLLATIGRHPERGAFVVTQSSVGAWIVAEFDAYRPTAEINGTMVADAIQVLRDVRRRGGASPVAPGRLLRLKTT